MLNLTTKRLLTAAGKEWLQIYELLLKPKKIFGTYSRKPRNLINQRGLFPKASTNNKNLHVLIVVLIFFLCLGHSADVYQIIFKMQEI